jgi:molybdenum cofactor cytidylyltransferase
MQGLEGQALERVRQLARRFNVPLLLEADGSRGLALKAPADWEPPIPAFADQVIVCAGMTGIGKPLSADWVYRPEDFSRLSGIPLNDPVTLEGLARVLLHEQGGQKNIPDGAERIIFLNQADTPELREAALELARSLLAGYDRVVVASLHGVDPRGPKAEVHAVYQPVAGIILAAGSARRMGRPKQVLDWDGEALVRRAARAAQEAGLEPVIVITGAFHTEVADALRGLKFRVVNNLDWESGQSTSVRAGVNALPPRTGAAVFLLADQPFVNSKLIRGLTVRHAQTLAPIVAPAVKGQRANPVLFDRRTFTDLMALTGDSGGRQVMGKWGVELVGWEDARILLDIDDDEDYQEALKQNLG